jgi:nitric oxide reductase NorE protein
MRSSSARAVPGDTDIWVFVLGDMVIFSAYFAAYLFLDRLRDPALFVESQHHLSQGLGLLNTLILLTSSLFVALSVQSARDGDRDSAARCLKLGAALGFSFLLVKTYEWTDKISSGLTITTNAFFMHYYMLTILHVMHVIIGFVFMVVSWRELQRPVPRIAVLEAGGIYWHMVDFLWILIFALLYLMR